MELPEDFRFTNDHEWADDQGDGTVRIGVTHFAQEALGDIVFVELPAEDEEFDKGDAFGVVESVKTVSDVYAPVSGRVVEVNDELESAPELVNDSPYDEGWIVEIEMSDPDEFEELMTADEYEGFLEGQE